MNAHTIETRTHGRYLVSWRPEATALVVGFHGYGENAVLHLEALERVVADRPARIVSIQGLNCFYTKANRVVAGWMTSEDRELAIADNLAYVSAVVAEVEREYGRAERVVYAGFSQGVAMAYRAAAFIPRRCDGLILLAGDVPPDVAPHASALPATLLGRGTTDEWYTSEKASRDVRTLGEAGVNLTEHVFTGGHVWEATFVARAGVFLDERLA